MDYFIMICQAAAALGILNVWLLRSKKATAYRGGAATDMKEEFAVYGLPAGFMYAIGTAKVTLALLLLTGLWVPVLSKPAAGGLAILMLGAIVMHFKVKDKAKKFLPASCVFLLSIIVVVL